MLTNYPAACAHLSITVFEIQRDIYEKVVILSYPFAFDAPVRGFPSEYRHPLCDEKTRMASLPDGEKNSKISLFVLTSSTNVTDGRTDRRTYRQTLRDSIDRACIASRGKNRHFIIPRLHSTPPLGGSRRNIGTLFGTEKLEWCRYPIVKKFRRYVYSFWRDPRTWRTDGRTDGQTLRHSKDRAYASHRAVKKNQFWRFRRLNAHVFKATTVKFGVRLRTWDTLPAPNCVKKSLSGLPVLHCLREVMHIAF